MSTLLFETEEKLEKAKLSYEAGKWSDSIYQSYTGIINTAKAVLIGENIKTNTQAGIIKDFDQYFIESGLIQIDGTLSDLVYDIKNNEATKEFAKVYFEKANEFYQVIDTLRTNAINDES